MSIKIAVIHEASADFQTATELTDRELVNTIDWLDEDQIDHQRTWLNELPTGERLTWIGIKKLALDRRIRAHGHFDGKAGKSDAAAARRAILLLLKSVPDLNAIVMIRDQDGDQERRAGLEQARTANRSKCPIVIGLAVVERECWVISGFEPTDSTESSRLDAERSKLGFDPRLESHKLTACKDDSAVRCSKRVLRALTGGDQDRERRCWKETSMDDLRRRGENNGLAAYLDDVRRLLAPLIGYVSNA